MQAMLAVLLVAAFGVALAEYDNNVWQNRDRPFVVGHRGSPYLFPEHSAASYLAGIDGGADFVECDVCLTKDLIPVCRHEPWLGPTTNVAKTSFVSRTKTYFIDGSNITDVFTVDLTLAELKTLRLRQKDSFRPLQFDGLFQILTLEEHIQLVQSAPRTVGIYPEFKHPTFFNTLPQLKAANTTFMDIVLDVLHKYGYTGPYNSPGWIKKPIFIQSFEQEDLIYTSQKTCIPLVQLLDSPGFVTPDRNKSYDEMVSDKSLDEIASYASGAGPWKNMLIAPNEAGTGVVSSGLTAKLQNRGMIVHLYTLRPEPQYIYPVLKNTTIFNELDQLLKVEGVDGGFSDAAVLYTAYLDAQKIAGYAWPLNQRQRWNARPATCKRNYSKTKYHKK